MTDFGTSRELHAADETWHQGQAQDYLDLRKAIESPTCPAPLEFGEIPASQPTLELPPGDNFAPEGHLEALPRLYMVEPLLELCARRLTPSSPPLESKGSAAVLAGLTRDLDALGRWATGRRPALKPAHLEAELWLHQAGRVELRLRFSYLPSVDFASPPDTILRDDSFAEVVAKLVREAAQAAYVLPCAALVERLGRGGRWPSASFGR